MHGTRAVPICMRIRGRFWMGACVVCFCQSRCTSSYCTMVLSGINAAYHHDMVMVVARSFIIVGRVDGWMMLVVETNLNVQIMIRSNLNATVVPGDLIICCVIDY